MTARDDLLRGDDVDAFELGSNEVEVQQSRNAARTPTRNDTGGIPHDDATRPRERNLVRLVGDIASPVPSRSEPM